MSPDGDSSWNGGQLPQTMALTSFELRVGSSDPFKTYEPEQGARLKRS